MKKETRINSFIITLCIAYILTFSFINSLEILEYNAQTNTDDNLNIPSNKCLEITFNTLFQHVLIEIEPREVNKMIITDKKLSISNGQNLINCDKNSLFCYEYIYPQKMKFSSNYCISKFFLYACSSVNNNSGDLSDSRIPNIKFNNKIEQMQCNLYQNKEEDIFCSLQNIDSCIDNSKCYNICEKLMCKSESESISLCIKKESESSKRKICENLLKTNVISSNSEECKSNIKSPKDKKNKETQIYKTLAIIIGVIMLFILLLSFYYRIKIKNNGNPPFNPPNFMPGFLFPRPN